jgi:hypothetical protein
MQSIVPSNFVPLPGAEFLTQKATVTTTTSDVVGAYIRYVGAPTAGYTPQVVITAGATGTTSPTWTFYTHYPTGGSGAVADSGIGTAGVVTPADATTWGALRTTINASTNWRMVLVAARPDRAVIAATKLIYTQAVVADSAAAVACSAPGGTPILLRFCEGANTTKLFAAICLGLEAETALGGVLGRMAESGISYEYKDIADFVNPGVPVSVGNHRTWVKKIRAYGIGATGLVYVYACGQSGTSRLLTGPIVGGTDTTAAWIEILSAENVEMVSQRGERIVVEFGDYAAVSGTPILEGSYAVGMAA